MQNRIETWPRCPEAAAFFQNQFHAFAAANPEIEAMAARFLNGAGVSILNLVDHWILPDTSGLPDDLLTMGYAEVTMPEGDRVWTHPEARLPRLRFKSKVEAPVLALGVESIAHFVEANGLQLASCHGDPDSRYLCAHYPLPNGELMLIERRGYNGFAPGTLNAEERARIEKIGRAHV